MVWRADESPLYKSVEKFNNEAQPQEPEPERRTRQEPPPKPDTEPTHRASSTPSGERVGAPEPEHCREKPEAPPPRDTAPKQCGQVNNKNFMSRLLGDRDFLLIAALIFLLWHEKADMKLIAALAYVLLG